ncbi:MAG TPA: hypothetical protein VK971_09060 [Thiohalobacter sp.]|nr:hypothetical protein [Thiohalobacter sp.]
MAELRIDGMDWDKRASVILEGLAGRPQRAVILRRAQKRAARKAARYAQRQVARLLSQATGVAQGKLTKSRIKVYLEDGELWEAKLWIGLDPLPAHRLGSVKWTPRMAGARAGRRLFPGSFAHQAPKGPIFIRSGEPPRIMTKGSHRGEVREPLRAESVELDGALEMNMQRIARETQRRYRKLMGDELNFELQKMLGNA